MENWMYIALAIGAMLAIGAVVTVMVMWYKGKLTDAQVARIWEWVCIAVQAAEQLFGPKTGEQKKQYVVDFLSGLGIEVTDKIDAMIEAAVGELNLKLAEVER